MSSPVERPTAQEASRAADSANQRLREAGFPERAIDAWWMLLKDPTLKKTPHRIWEAGDFTTLDSLVRKTLRNQERYRSKLEQVISDHFAEQLAMSSDVRARLLGSAS